MSNNQVRVRFAPSPTGMLHIGGARTAIYNWAFARARGGKFILRIEDTDRERSTDENTQIILRALKWLGLDWDEGPEIGGEFGPYFQTERMQTYKDALDKLIESGDAYPCFCTKEELDAKREKANKEQGGYAGYDGTCRHLSAEEAKRRIEAGQPHVWRLKVPKDHAPITFDDEVYGHMEFPCDVMDDLILVRTDGMPTYNFAVVCDDSNMRITHVVRGDDHLSNTPRQILIYEALGLEVPTFAHLPMILGSDGKKLSKRHGATNVEEYRDAGYLPDVMVNFLALLGWSLDGETTIIPRDVLTQKFSLNRINKKDCIFDETKLDWMNGAYIRDMDVDSWANVALPWIKKTEGAKTSHIKVDIDFAKSICPLLIERMVRFNEIPKKIEYFFWDDSVVLDEKSVNKVLLKEGARADEALRIAMSVLTDESNSWEFEPLQEKVKALGEKAGLKPKLIFQPIRVAVCGNMVSPPLFESIVLMKREDVIARIQFVLDKFFA